MQYIDYGGRNVYVQSSNSWGTWERAVSSPIGVWDHNATKCKKIVYKCKWKLCGFHKDKNSSRTKLLICEFK